MKRYRFRLETVLRVRRVQEDMARGHLAHATAEVGAATSIVRAAEAHLRELAAGAAVAAGPAGLWGGAHELALTGAHDLKLVETDLAAAVSRRLERQAELAAARARVRALERLDERRREEYLLDSARAAEREVDDLVTSRFRAGERER
jgi:flagellar FliJ protein